jgi:hypothetical protein
MPSARTLLSGAAVALLAPAAAHGATLTTSQPCYIEGQEVGIAGEGWTAGSEWTVSADGIFASGQAGADGTFLTSEAQAPTVVADTFKPQTVSLRGTENGTEVASTSFKVVNFLVKPRSLNGKPTGKTTWVFSGFTPGKKLYFHIKRGKRVYTQKAGRSRKPCGTFKRRMRRLPAVPERQIHYGRYRVFVDNRRRFSRGGLQFRATITIYKRFI